MAVKLTFVKSVTSSIPINGMQIAKLAMVICNCIDNFDCVFLWDDMDTKKKVHLMTWEERNNPIRIEGLGIRSTRQANVALLSKLGLRLLMNESSLWVEVIKEKFVG